jgi:hypothetical protein
MNTLIVSSCSRPLLGRARRWFGLGALILALAGTAHAGEKSFKHEVLMRGQILEANSGALVVCVGEADGAKVGQILEVVRHKRVSRNAKAAGPRFRREAVGQVRITELFDTHYAEAVAVTGKPQVNDTVELIRQ